VVGSGSRSRSACQTYTGCTHTYNILESVSFFEWSNEWTVLTPPRPIITTRHPSSKLLTLFHRTEPPMERTRKIGDVQEDEEFDNRYSSSNKRYRTGSAASHPEHLLPAAERGDALTVSSALRNPITDPNMTDADCSTALMLAASKGHAEVVRALLADQRVEPDKTDENDCTALMLASHHGHTPVVELLLRDDRVDPTRVDEDGDTPLILAAANGHTSIAELLIRDDRIDLNVRNLDGDTALSWATTNGHTAFVNLLLEYGHVDSLPCKSGTSCSVS
jgi:hypothetical protein